MAATYYVIFGVLTAAGGVLGWVRARSVASLVAGLVSGALLCAAGAMASGGRAAGDWLALVVSVLLLGRFGPVWLRGGKPMPAVPMTVLALIGVVVAAWALVPALFGV
jgi:uncharacterized membrane protein (UPF0136 family)